MAKFEFVRENITLEAYGKEYPIPTKTAALVDGINDIQKKLAACTSAAETVAVTKQGIALFIGKEEAERIFPVNKLADVDTDEISAFWWALNNESNNATRAVVEKYAPNQSIRKAK